MRITSMLLSLSDLSILSMSVSVAVMLLRSIESAGKGQLPTWRVAHSFPAAEMSGDLPATPSQSLSSGRAAEGSAGAFQSRIAVDSIQLTTS
jgi:hypothetical protein